MPLRRHVNKYVSTKEHEVTNRRKFGMLAAVSLAAPATLRNYSRKAYADLSRPLPDLLSAPLELAGDWGRMLEGAVVQVVERMRHACLGGVRLLSDRQPTSLRIEE